MTRSLDVGPLHEIRRGRGPTVGVAVHAGHDLRAELVPCLALSEQERLREEDPYADYWTQACHSQVLTRRSRFEIDLNRPRDDAVYVAPAAAWGLEVWKRVPNREMIRRSEEEHEEFYRDLADLLDETTAAEGGFVVFDLHSYNHRRAGPDAAPADPALNPDVNVGTGSLDRARWGGVVDAFMESLRAETVDGRRLDVRENVKFRGRELAAFVHHRYPRTGCCLAIEVKKFFMDEWSGNADSAQVVALLEAFRRSVPPVVDALREALR